MDDDRSDERRIEDQETLIKPAAGDPRERVTAQRLPAPSIVRRLLDEGQPVRSRRLRPLADEPTAAAPNPVPGTDRYEVLSDLGQGGMGRVYLVLDRDLGRRVALKVVRHPDDVELGLRFLDEAQVMGQLQHPNILPVYELGLAVGSQPYYTMPVVRGQTLAQILSDIACGAGAAAGWSRVRLIQVFLQVVHAMDYAHSKGVIHRDLKPANVMVGEHGEVQVLDWGLSKLVPLTSDRESTDDDDGTSGIVGTPQYMSPEQARGEAVDARSDVYALGVMLYEMLTLRPPFEGSLSAVLDRQVWDEPVAPRVLAPDRDIPIELERICLRALSKQPTGRQQSVKELFEEIEAWLEAETDRDKRRQQADSKTQAALQLLAEFRHLDDEVKAREWEVHQLADGYRTWQSVVAKRPLFQAQDQVTAARRRRTRILSEIVETLTSALGFDPQHRGAREALADLYWYRFQAAEAERDADEAAFYGELVAAYHDGKYSRELRGDGSVSLEAVTLDAATGDDVTGDAATRGWGPAGADAWLYTLVEHDLCLVPRQRSYLGKTPLGPVPLAMGSYLVVLQSPGLRPATYPVHIRRCGEWNGVVRLYDARTIGDGFVQVPGGPFQRGGDELMGSRADAPSLPDFAIARHPVTLGEYIEFLDDLTLADRDSAVLRAPRRAPGSETYLECVDRKWSFRRSAESQWHPRLPVFGVSFEDATAYCRWRSGVEGRRLRLPTSDEWEKAARGVDGRFYPWGNRFDPSLCNVRDSLPDRTVPVPVTRFPYDRSVYGVRGMAGNVQDWTGSEFDAKSGDDDRLLRGGAWGLNPFDARCTFRDHYAPDFVIDVFGFRLAHSLEPPEEGG